MENTYMKESRAEMLIASEAEYGVLMDMILNTASLAYNKQKLTFDSDVIGAFVKAVDPDGYKQRLEELKEEENE